MQITIITRMGLTTHLFPSAVLLLGECLDAHITLINSSNTFLSQLHVDRNAIGYWSTLRYVREFKIVVHRVAISHSSGSFCCEQASGMFEWPLILNISSQYHPSPNSAFSSGTSYLTHNNPVQSNSIPLRHFGRFSLNSRQQHLPHYRWEMETKSHGQKCITGAPFISLSPLELPCSAPQNRGFLNKLTQKRLPNENPYHNSPNQWNYPQSGPNNCEQSRGSRQGPDLARPLVRSSQFPTVT